MFATFAKLSSIELTNRNHKHNHHIHVLVELETFFIAHIERTLEN